MPQLGQWDTQSVMQPDPVDWQVALRIERTRHPPAAALEFACVREIFNLKNSRGPLYLWKSYATTDISRLRCQFFNN